METLPRSELESSITVEAARLEDAEEMVKVHSQSWIETYPNDAIGLTEVDVQRHLSVKATGKVERYREQIKTQDDSHHMAFVARKSGKIIGLSLPHVEKDGRHRLGALYTLRDVHGQGVGDQLIEQALKWHGNNDVFLMVTSYNERAIRFYKKHGFELTGREDFEEVGGVKMPELEMVRHNKE